MEVLECHQSDRFCIKHFDERIYRQFRPYKYKTKAGSIMQHLLCIGSTSADLLCIRNL